VIPRLYLAKNGGICMPVQCHHCEDAPCKKSCLTGAIERKDGVVVINERKCIGCRNCAISCPFGAIEVFSLCEASAFETNCSRKVTPKIVFKCDLCTGETEPACVKTCPNEALRLVDAQSEIVDKRINAINAFGAYNPPAQSAAAASAGGAK
jgi:electron transport protein HydN